jgi:hypothetical protein
MAFPGKILEITREVEPAETARSKKRRGLWSLFRRE